MSKEDQYGAVAAALARLNSEPDVSQYLIDHDYKGFPARACECPVANYVALTTGVSIAIFEEWHLNNDVSNRFATPPKVFRFIKDFDRGAYPELALEDEEGW